MNMENKSNNKFEATNTESVNKDLKDGIKKRKFSKRRRDYKINCRFCKNKELAKDIHFFNLTLLNTFLNEKHMINSSRYNSVCKKHQRKIRNEVIIARHLHLISYISY